MTNSLDLGFYGSEDLRKMGFMNVGQKVYVAKNVTIVGIENIYFGNNIRIDAYSSLISPQGFIRLGSNIHIAAGAYIGGSGGVEFSDFSAISHGVKIYSASDDYSGSHLTNSTINPIYRNVIQGKVELKKHVIIGSNSVVLPNCVLGEGVAVGALSLVKDNLDPWCIYAGSPTRKIGQRSTDLLGIEKKWNLELN